jgi:hypothetical protein
MIEYNMRRDKLNANENIKENFITLKENTKKTAKKIGGKTDSIL